MHFKYGVLSLSFSHNLPLAFKVNGVKQNPSHNFYYEATISFTACTEVLEFRLSYFIRSSSPLTPAFIYIFI